jgi:adenosylhomocysteinase
MPMIEAVRTADVIITATGCKDIITEEHIALLKDGCVMGNSGHFDNEISKPALERVAGKPRKAREFVESYDLPGGRKAYLIADGRLMNLAAGQGHPAEIMDMSFSVQALSLEALARGHCGMAPSVHPVPRDLDERVAAIKLRTMGVRLDKLTVAQDHYLHDWKEGT